MAINFPASPVLNEEYTFGTKTWIWNGTAWSLKNDEPVVILDLIKTVDGAGSGLDSDLLDGNHSTAFYLASNPSGYTTNTGTVTSISTNNGITGGTITTTGSIGLTGQALALHSLATNGIFARTGSGTVAARTLTAGTGISISDGDGVAGNPTITNSSPNVTTDITITHNASNVVVNSSDGTDGTVNAATTSLAGVMSATDKTKLDGIAANANNYGDAQVDTHLNTSTAIAGRVLGWSGTDYSWVTQLATSGGITNIAIVASLPGSPDANTLYIVTA